MLLLNVGIHDLSEDQIEGEECSDRYQHAEVDIANVGIFVCISKVVHDAGPALECANLEHGHDSLEEIIEAGDTVSKLLVRDDVIEYVWAEIVALPE